jgi:hypothetical protein
MQLRGSIRRDPWSIQLVIPKQDEFRDNGSPLADCGYFWRHIYSSSDAQHHRLGTGRGTERKHSVVACFCKRAALVFVWLIVLRPRKARLSVTQPGLRIERAKASEETNPEI